jgi:diamine N-acetyltransferase
MYIISRSGLLDTVGICGLTSIDHVGRTAEFSILINSVFRRKGLAGKALKTLLWHGFSDLNLNLIWGETFVGNPAISLYERLGFTKEGTLRERYFKEGAYIDTHVYSIKRDEFIALC